MRALPNERFQPVPNGLRDSARRRGAGGINRARSSDRADILCVSLGAGKVRITGVDFGVSKDTARPENGTAGNFAGSEGPRSRAGEPESRADASCNRHAQQPEQLSEIQEYRAAYFALLGLEQPTELEQKTYERQ